MELICKSNNRAFSSKEIRLCYMQACLQMCLIILDSSFRILQSNLLPTSVNKHISNWGSVQTQQMDGPCMNRLQERQCGMQCHPSWTVNSSSLRQSSPQLRLHILFLFLDEGKPSPTPPLQRHFTRAEWFAFASIMSKLLPNISRSTGHAEILTHCEW